MNNDFKVTYKEHLTTVTKDSEKLFEGSLLINKDDYLLLISNDKGLDLMSVSYVSSDSHMDDIVNTLNEKCLLEGCVIGHGKVNIVNKSNLLLFLMNDSLLGGISTVYFPGAIILRKPEESIERYLFDISHGYGTTFNYSLVKLYDDHVRANVA